MLDIRFASPALTFSSILISRLIKSYRYKAYNEGFLSNMKRPPIFALFHSYQMIIASYRAPFKINVLVSLSKDGEIASQVLRRLGFGVVRGSSSKRGLEALNELVELVNRGESAAITVDGPRGPLEEVKSGVIRLAQKTGAPIVCVSAIAKPMYRLKNSWDMFVVAPPFAKIVIYFSDPIYIEEHLDVTGVDFYKKKLKEQLRLLFYKCSNMNA
ncbi:MAG: lysophospholipid acyltransferase family protein [Deltaproteobacteria bacterium]|nr:lysophospholipid acyltransferase family protein [Deltaproteobacteria bacterium]